MGSSSSKPAVVFEEPVPDFYYKKKPHEHEMPAWFKSIRLEPEELPHLKTVGDLRSG